MNRLVVGCMTGTSIDGIDAALVRISGRGLSMKVKLLHHAHRSLGRCGTPLRALANGSPLRAAEITRAARDLADRHVDAISKVIQGRRIQLICVHGQTVFHAPPLSWQLINPAPIAAAFGVPVVHDLRSADIAAGGQGAPLTPLADFMMFRAPKPRAIVNLGGFCNITVLPASHKNPEDIRGMDVCVCNLLLDRIASELLHVPFDRGGKIAARGSVHDECRKALSRFLSKQSRSGRSLGSGDECSEWISAFCRRVKPEDMLATATDVLGELIAKSCVDVRDIIVAGGGAKNRSVVRAIQRHAERSMVRTADEIGVSVEAREAACFAILGALAQDGVPISLQHVTGVKKAPRSGSFMVAP
jgi:1,6-anhydro-N-acetylmuramate kinase